MIAAVDAQNLVDALGLGAVYALMAVGIGLVFGVLRLVNFAYGQLIMAGAYALAFASQWSWPLWAAVPFCFAVVIALSLATLDHFRGLAKHVQVFKHVIRDASMIMAAQPTFEKMREGVRAERFRTRHYFGDALVFLKLRSAWTNSGTELVHWWQQHL